MIIRYTERALTEIDLGILWYEEQKRGLGLTFWTVLKLPYKRFRKIPKFIKKGILISGDAQFGVSLFRLFIRLKILKS